MKNALIEIEDIGCEEKMVNFTFRGALTRGFWIPRTGAFRYWGESKPRVYCANKRELTLWLASRG